MAESSFGIDDTLLQKNHPEFRDMVSFICLKLTNVVFQQGFAKLSSDTGYRQGA
jgi:hypothetical protein